MKLYVQTEKHILSSHRENEEFGEWSETHSFDIKGVYLKHEKEYSVEEFEVPFKVKPKDDVYVLYMIYSSGDTFGHSEGNGEVLWVFKDKELAQQALEQVKEKIEGYGKKGFDYAYSLEFKTESGKTIKLSNPAAGYFENLESLYIQRFTVEQEPSIIRAYTRR